MIKVSVIIPSFKRVDQTIRTISLIKSSKINNNISLEIIVSDSTSDDSLKNAIRQKFEKQIAYTKPIKKGISTNKNQGAKIASGDILIFCDSDIEVEPDTIAKTIKYLKENEYAAATGGRVIWKGGDRDGKNDRLREEDRLYEFKGFKAIEALYSRYVATYKDVFWKVGGYDEAVFNMRGEGSDLSIRYWRAGYPLFYNPETIVYHIHDAPDSIALRIENPERGVAKDLMLLAYKYDMLDGNYMNFQKTIKANFGHLGEGAYAKISQTIENEEDLATLRVEIDRQRESMSNLYDFKFLEVFSDLKLLGECLDTASERLKETRLKIFEE